MEGRTVIFKLGKTFFQNLKLRNKIALSTVSLLLFSTILTLFFIYIQSKSIVEEKSYNETHQIVVQLTNYYDEKLAKIINLTQGIFENENFKNSLENIVWNSQYSYAIESTTMQTLFQKTRLKDSFLDSFFLYTERGVFYEDIYKLRPTLDFTSSQMYRSFKNNFNISWQSRSKDEIFVNDASVIPVVLSTTLEGIYNRAVFVVNLKESAVKLNLKDISITNKASIYLLNTNGEMITSQEYKNYESILSNNIFIDNISENENGHFSYKYKGEKLDINYAKIKINGWKVIIVQPESVLLKDVYRLQWFVLLAGLFSLTFAGILSVLIAATITKPINSLRSTMVKVQNGELGSRFNNKYLDEIGELGESFNGTLDKIQALIVDLEIEREKTKEEEKQKIKAEIKALQAQINPHFLYNTLDSIYWKSKLGENELVSEMIISLSSLLRIALSKGKDKIPVISEIEHVTNYLYLLKNMYNDKFEYEIELKNDITKYCTVKLLLQPIVENSLLHGFDVITYKGKILIQIEIKGDNIHFKIIDNGKGIDVEAAKKALLSNETEPKGYALRNVYQRIVLNYGEEYGIYFNSEPFKETTVEIIIPLEEC